MQLQKQALTVKKSSVHGWGIFAETDIDENSIIEECYTLQLTSPAASLSNYYFGGGNDVWLLPLGNGSIFNHSSEPNAVYQFDVERSLMTFRATKKIFSGEEIFISYGEHWFSSRAYKEKIPSMKFRVKQLIYSMSVLIRSFIVICALTFIVFAMQKL